MAKHSDTYASKIRIAEKLAQMDCRAVTLSAVAKTRPLDSRKVVKQVKGTHSNSGQTPSDHQWFFETVDRRRLGALLVLEYHYQRERYNDNHDAHGVAFALAFDRYFKFFKGDTQINPERFNLLVTKGYDLNWRKIASGESTIFEYDNVCVLLCRSCRIPHLVEAHLVSYTCPRCDGTSQSTLPR
jgi:hypothetical protein